MTRPRHGAPGALPRRTWTSVSIGLVAVAATLYAIGVAWFLPIVVLGVLVRCVASRTDWSTGVALGTVVPLALLPVTASVAASTPVALDVMFLVVLTALGVTAVAATAPGTAGPPRALTLGVLAVPLAVTLVAVISSLRGVGSSWALWNDTVYHLFDARQVVAAGGADGSNADPLVSELVAVFLAPSGSADLGAAAASSAVVALLMLGWLGVVGSTLVASAVPASQVGVRVAVAMAAGLVPWTWFVAGFATRFGFVNVVAAMPVLAASWLLWAGARRRPVVSSAGLMLAATALLAAWAVLALIPMALGAWVILRHWRQHLAAPTAEKLLWSAALALSGGYALLVSGPAVAPGSSQRLSSEGAFFDFDPWRPAVVLVLLVLAAAAAGRARAARRDLLGVGLLVAATAVGLGMLLAPRRGEPVPFFGYYPQKYTWVLCVLAVLLIGRALARAVSVDLERRRDRVAAPVVVLGAMLATMAVVPPSASPLRAEGWFGLKQLVPLASVVDGVDGDFRSDFGTLDEAFDLVTALESRDAVLVSRYLDDTVAEHWADEWLVRLAQERGDAVERHDISTREPTDVDDLCAVLRAWKPGVTVVTRDVGLEAELAGTCPDAAAVVEVGR